jgi:hypothetical protein
VCEARHNGSGLALRHVDQRSLQPVQDRAERVDLLAQVEAQVGGDLVVARAPGVQLFAGFADALDQACLDVHVDIFQGNRPVKSTLFDFSQDAFESVDDGTGLVSGDDADMAEHAGVRDRARDVVAIQALVKADRGGKFLDEGIGGLGKAPTPGLRCRFTVGHGQVGPFKVRAVYRIPAGNAFNECE